MFSTVVILGSHCDLTGLAAARIDVLAFNCHMMPALAIDKVCCSLKKWIRVKAFSLSLQLQEKEQVNFHSNSFNYTFKCT